MSGTLDFNPAQLELARHRRGMTVAALARELARTPRTVARWESGESTPGEGVIEQLSRTLGFPPSFFCQDAIEELPIASVSFRALSKTSAGMRNSAVAAGRLTVAISDWIDRTFRLPPPNVPSWTGYEPELAAASLRERWGLGTEPIANVVHLLEANGIRVFSLDSSLASVDAFSFFSKDRPFALVNTRKTGERQRFDLAHELGHLVMHGEDHEMGRDAEAHAQRFAAAFLMPSADVMAQPLWNADAQAILWRKRRWRVAAMALTHRLRELEMLTEWGYRDACVSLSQAGYRRSEPFDPIVPETSQVLGKVFKSLRDSGVSSRVIAAELNLSEDELQRHVFGLVPVPLSGEGVGGKSNADLRVVPRSAARG